MLYGNPHLTGVEHTFDENEIIVTKTDLAGKITYGNDTFYKMSGFSEKESLGKQHNIIRHPEMPRAAFKLVWDTLASGEEVFAYVNNRSKNGDHYWVFAHITPSFNTSGKLVGYHSSRRKPDRRLIEDKIIPLYRDLLATEKAASSPKEGMDNAVQAVLDLLGQTGMGFNELMLSLGR
ncbi:PAS domain-containing protein [Curvivirga aplysinae]|uniref:PAS domain-containing protein n=1 Tax=Curvivirga aplysinae TaxID=2529852 RepID=UPI0012BC955C|nr:PAS domain-containing protein [Curvivirga aplysinae]MTI10492.1 PAS domain S-box protein [Curvivirga aplysinae]